MAISAAPVLFLAALLALNAAVGAAQSPQAADNDAAGPENGVCANSPMGRLASAAHTFPVLRKLLYRPPVQLNRGVRQAYTLTLTVPLITATQLVADPMAQSSFKAQLEREMKAIHNVTQVTVDTPVPRSATSVDVGVKIYCTCSQLNAIDARMTATAKPVDLLKETARTYSITAARVVPSTDNSQDKQYCLNSVFSSSATGLTDSVSTIKVAVIVPVMVIMLGFIIFRLIKFMRARRAVQSAALPIMGAPGAPGTGTVLYPSSAGPNPAVPFTVGQVQYSSAPYNGTPAAPYGPTTAGPVAAPGYGYGSSSPMPPPGPPAYGGMAPATGYPVQGPVPYPAGYPQQQQQPAYGMPQQSSPVPQDPYTASAAALHAQGAADGYGYTTNSSPVPYTSPSPVSGGAVMYYK